MEIFIKFNFCQDIIKKCYSSNEILRNILMDYTEKKGLKFEKLFFLCDGTKISNFDQTLHQFAKLDKQKIELLNILVYEVDEAEIQAPTVNIPHTQRENVNKNNFMNNKQINFGNDNFINNAFNKNKSVMVNQEETIENFNPNINQNNFNNNLFNPNEKLTINFKYNGMYHPIKCTEHATIEQLCSKFVKLKESNIKYFKFIYRNKDFYQFPNKTIGDFIVENKITFEDKNNEGKKIKGITINVEENKPWYCRHKTKLFAFGSILLGVIIVLIIYFATKDKDKDNN